MQGSPDRELSPDHQYLSSGAVSLFLKPDVLDAAIAVLQADGYNANEICSDSEDTIYNDIGRAFDWERLFGYHPPNNLNALQDGLTDGNGPKRLLVFRAYDAFHTESPEAAHAFMDVLERASRDNLLFGERLAVFVQVSNPRFELNNLGARHAGWNQTEWLDKDRGL